MKENLLSIPANQVETTLYCYMGEALCNIQHVEQALSHLIALKTHPVNKEDADKALTKNLSYTLGKALKLGQDQALYPSSLQEDLNSFLEMRNWLIHKAIVEIRECLYMDTKRDAFFKKIKSITIQAHHIQHAIEMDMIEFCTARGKDMSDALAMVGTRLR